MAASGTTKKEADPQARKRQGRRREIAGILLMACGLFAGLSLLSMQLGDGRMMGRGGAAAASALYGAGGFRIYLVVGGMLVASIRCFRARPMIDGPAEGA